MWELAEPLVEDADDDEETLGPRTPPKPGTEPECPATDVHFIRCLKPNDKKIPDYFAHTMTLQ